MGRPKLDNVKIQFHIQREIYNEIMRLIPEIQNPSRPGTFRNSGAQKYFTMLLLNDLAERRRHYDAKKRLQANAKP